MKSKNALVLVAVGMTCAIVKAAVTVTEADAEFLTYPFSDPDPVPAIAEKRYPYFRYDGSSAKGEMRKWKTVTLKNEKISVTMMPEIGGKVWGATDLKTGVDFVYHNHVVKFRDIAMRGPWVSGGIEFNFGIIGHAPSSSTPVDWFVRENADGSASFFAASYEYVTRSFWQVEVRLRPGVEEFETHTTWYNASGLPQPYYHWMNAAFHLEDDARFLFDGKAYAGHEGDVHSWPMDKAGHKLDVYSGNAFGRSKSYHILPGDNGAYGVWWPKRGVGAVHAARSWEKYGRKVWLWALSRQGGIWEDLLTDSDGQYTELQSGRYFIQPAEKAMETPFKHPRFSPGSTESFSETWGVLRKPEDMKRYEAQAPKVARPAETHADFNWQSAVGKSIRGWQYLLQRIDGKAVTEFTEALAKEPHLVSALVGMASIEMRRGEYAACHRYCRGALAVDTTDEDANYFDGFAFFAEGDYASARDRLGVAAFGTRNRSAAYALIARSYLAEGNRDLALEAAARSISANSANLDAHLCRLIALRGKPEARTEADAILEKYPLFHAARFERDGVDFAKLVRNELVAETFREIGWWYSETGLKAEAERLFELARSSEGNLPPFRREELPGLRKAAEADGWQGKFKLAVLEGSFHRDAEADALLEKCGNAPDDPTFYLVRASRRKGEAAVADFRRAEEVGDSWRVGRAWAAHHAVASNSVEMLAVTSKYIKKYPKCNPLQIAYADALSRNGRYRETLDFLSGVAILPSENGDNAIGPWHAAQKALKLPLTYPENLGVGEPYPDAKKE